MKFVLTAFCVFLVSQMSDTAAAQTPAAMRSVWDGVYSADQAARGEPLFARNCQRCHRGDYFSNAEALPLKGPGFMERWREDNVENFFNRMKSFMPPSPSGGPSIKLPDQEYLDIIAFLFQSNAFPVGSAELALNHVHNVQITAKEGPQPVPNLATIKVVGCLTEVNGRWTISNTSEPVRNRQPDATNPQELAASATAPLGTLTFELRGLDTFGAFDPDANKGHKLQVKGVLNRQPNNRITVLSAESVGATCGS